MNTTMKAHFGRFVSSVLSAAVISGCASGQYPSRYGSTGYPLSRTSEEHESEDAPPEEGDENAASNNSDLLGLGAALVGLWAVHEMTTPPSSEPTEQEKYDERLSAINANRAKAGLPPK